MRFAATALLWLFTTAALAAAVPMAWVQQNLVDADGYAALAQKAAGDPALQSAVAAELSAKATALISQRGSTADPSTVHQIATAYTAGPSFPPQFAQANRLAHQWMFTRPRAQSDPWVIDLAPMLEDSAFQQMLADYHMRAPTSLNVPVTVTPPKTLRPAKLRPLAIWGPWVSIAAAVLTGISALLTLAVARNRGRALAALGVSALLVGAAGWAGVEIARRRIDAALNHTTGDVRSIAAVMVDHAEAGVHHWLNLTLAAGGVLVALGVLAAVYGTITCDGSGRSSGGAWL
ncbi:hypothetical protein MFM001_18320 [Mycobacterium sp. MFM001]|uniref:hypothetical protein n=1 Tax=Mycobacterium sp. MFM001 TaxID=2049453 RepID=UPI000DA47949|nr:hypothetical protein [Mycobacterium sp. MFM001]GBE65370.1 hypothetical protein MFM001_18320 [Mycobacterium sp. MFM001]